MVLSFGHLWGRWILHYLIAKLVEQRAQIGEAAVYVAYYVKWPVLVLEVVPQRLALDLGGVHLLLPLEHEDVPVAFLAQTRYGSAHLLRVSPHHVRGEAPVRPAPVPLLA